MQTTITGRVYVMGDNIDTDQIIPAQFLSYDPTNPEERKYFGKYANSGVPEGQQGLPKGDIPFVVGDSFRSDYAIVIGGKNFGCGSSREHAPLALAEAGVRAVVAEFYARIFFRNSVNGGYLLPIEGTERLVEKFQTGDTATLDTIKGTLINHRTNESFKVNPLGDVLPIVEAGGVFNYAREAGMIK